MIPRVSGYVAAVLFVAGSVGILKLFAGLTDAAQALLLLVAVFIVARLWESGPGVLAALLATLAFNFFFLPPLYTLTISDPRNVVALSVFLAAALIIGRLSALSRLRLRQLQDEQRDLAALVQLSQSFLSDTNRESLAGLLADRLRRALECRTAVLLLPDAEGRLEVASKSGPDAPRLDLAEIAFRQGNSASYPSALGGTDVYLPIPLGVARVGALAATGVVRGERLVEGCAALIGLSLERERFLKGARDTEVARARDEMKSTLLATLAHDLKTPVAGARAAVENWQATAGSSREAVGAAEALDRLTRVIDDLLKVVRLEADVADPRAETVSCAAILEAALARFGGALESRNLFVDTPPTNLDVHVDPSQAAETVGLVIENAARYSPRDSEIRVALRRDAGDAIFEVSDRGPGIPREDRDRVFQKFVRLPSTSSRPGSGLGLYIARSLAELNGGSVTLSDSPAGGLTVRISYPEVAA